jgi:hypothetical protein
MALSFPSKAQVDPLRNSESPVTTKFISFSKVSSIVFAISAVASLEVPANAAVVVTASEVGKDVVFTGGGSLNISDLVASLSSFFIDGYVNSGLGIYQGAGAGGDFSTPATIYTNVTFVGPTSFGAGGEFIADSVFGDFGGIRGRDFPGVLVSDSYISGEPLSGTSIFSNQTFASMGLTPGSYIWTWGTTNADSYQLNIGAVSNPVPAVPSPLPFFGAAAAFGYSRKLRKRIKGSTLQAADSIG